VRPGFLRIRAFVGVPALLVALALPATALAAAPFGGLSTPTTTVPALSTTHTATTAAPVTAPTTSSGSGGISTLDVVGIGAVALGLFGTIIYVIRRDAHAHAPRRATSNIDRGRATVAPRTERIKRSRARTKAARRARKTGR
jgi:hypothetical protein